jgi:ATP-dependent helicase/nuclease subunit B
VTRLDSAEAEQLALASGNASLSFSQRWALAETLGALHRELSAAGVSFDSICEQIGDGDTNDDPYPLAPSSTSLTTIPETQRHWWRIVRNLFEHRTDILSEHGLVDRDGARWEVLAGNVTPRVNRLIVACCPDLSAQAQRAVEVFPGAVEILIHAPADAAAGFTATGTIDESFWQSYPIPIPPSQLHIAADPRQEALAVVDTLSAIAPHCTVLECAIAPLTEVTRRAIRAQFDQSAIPFFDADAPPAPLLTLVSWLRAAIDFARTGGRADAWRLLRHPHSLGLADPGTALHAMLDNINKECVQSAIPLHGNPRTFPVADAIEHALGRLSTLLAPFRDCEPQPIAAWAPHLSALFDGCHLADQIDAATHRSLEATLLIMRDTAQISPVVGSEALTLFADTFSLVHTPETESTPAIDSIGWLELHLDDSPNLVIAGFVENAVPEVLNSDPFLPNSLRRQLGLPSNEYRMARESYLLSALLASRNTHLFLHRHLPDGSQTLPSRLLYRDSAARSIAIARQFFIEPTPRWRPLAAANPLPPPASFIAARPPTAPIDRELSLPVTALRDYLACPYRFYLSRILKLQTTPPPLTELDLRLFGNLLHNTLQSLGSHVAKQSSPQLLGSERDLRTYLFSTLDTAFDELVGAHPSQAAKIQRESARYRLGEFVTWQVASYAEGWHPIETEFSLDPSRTKRTIGETTISLTGRIDRIERNIATGAVRILDFKSSKSAPRVWSARSGWGDPQLPFYALLLHGHPPFSSSIEEIGACHVVLNGGGEVKAIDAALPPERFDAVESLLAKTLSDIASGIFWPPAPSVPFDNFAPIIGTAPSRAAGDTF